MQSQTVLHSEDGLLTVTRNLLSFTDVREALKYMRELPEVAMNETEIQAHFLHFFIFFYKVIIAPIAPKTVTLHLRCTLLISYPF